MKLTLPYPPSSNRYWRNVNGRMVKSAEARSYQTEVQFRLMAARLKNKCPRDPLQGDLVATLNFYRPQKSGDLDNRIKIVLDSLQGLVFNNDSQISVIHAARFEDKTNPRVEAHIDQVNSA